jgi:hypothetical protein
MVDSVEKLTSEGLLDMQNEEYLEAIKKFESALSELWPCHRGTPLDRCIEYHWGNANVCAGLLGTYSGLDSTYSYSVLNEETMEDGFYSSAVLQRHPGGPNLAMPCWTIIPMLYHAPPDYNMCWSVQEQENYGDESGENRKCILRDGYGTELEIAMVRIEQYVPLLLSSSTAQLLY